MFVPPIRALTKPSLAFLGSDFKTSDSAAYTFSSFGLGDPALNKTIIVVAFMGDAGNNGYTIDACTIGGVPANPVFNSIGASSGEIRMFSLFAPNVAAEDIVVTMSNTATAASIAVYKALGLLNGTAVATITNAQGSPASISTLTVPAGGFIIGAALDQVDGSSHTFTELVEDYDQLLDGVHGVASASKSYDVTTTPVFTALSASGSNMMCAASWR